MKYRITIVCAIFVLLILSGCMEDPASEMDEITIDNVARVLTEFEKRGDFINSREMPTLIEAEELYENISDYLIIDIRVDTLYRAGHVENAINVDHSELLGYLQNINYDIYKKIILISETGQAASYYNCLLQLYGFQNVYTLKFGMSVWHFDFAGRWLDVVSNRLYVGDLDNYTNPKPDYSHFAGIGERFGNSDIGGVIEERITDLLNEPFLLDDAENSNITIDMNEIANRMFTNDQGENVRGFIMCYGSDALKYLGGKPSEFEGRSHPVGTIWYNNWVLNDLRSISYLQTIPSDRLVGVYSTSGHESGFVVAYLRILGYNAKAILYGAHSFTYGMLFGKETLIPFIFSTDKIKNYPYIVEE